MDYFLTKWGQNLEILKVNVYNQKLQLIYSGKLRRGQEPKIKNMLEGCSLLFDLQDTSFWLQVDLT